MSPNSRKYPRAPMTGQIRFYNWNRPLQAEVIEISANGMFLRTDVSITEGSLLTLRLAVPGITRPFTVLGKVARTVRGNLLRPAGLGIEFIDIAAADRRMVLEYVARRTLRAAA